MKPCQFEAWECSTQATSVLTLVSLKPTTSHTSAKNYTILPLRNRYLHFSIWVGSIMFGLSILSNNCPEEGCGEGEEKEWEAPSCYFISFQHFLISMPLHMIMCAFHFFQTICRIRFEQSNIMLPFLFNFFLKPMLLPKYFLSAFFIKHFSSQIDVGRPTTDT